MDQKTTAITELIDFAESLHIHGGFISACTAPVPKRHRLWANFLGLRHTRTTGGEGDRRRWVFVGASVGIRGVFGFLGRILDCFARMNTLDLVKKEILSQRMHDLYVRPSMCLLHNKNILDQNLCILNIRIKNIHWTIRTDFGSPQTVLYVCFQ